MEQGEVAEDVVCLGYDLPDDKTFERFTRETFLANYYIDETYFDKALQNFLIPYSYVAKNNETLWNEVEVNKKITSKVEINGYLTKLALFGVDVKSYYGLLTKKVLENYLNYALEVINFDDLYLLFIHEESRKFESIFALFHKGKPDKNTNWFFSRDEQYLYLYKRGYRNYVCIGKARLKDHDECFKLYLHMYTEFDAWKKREEKVHGFEFAEFA